MFTDSSDGQTGFIQIEVTYWNTIRGRLRCSEVWGLRKFLVNLNGWLTNNGVCVCVCVGGGDGGLTFLLHYAFPHIVT